MARGEDTSLTYCVEKSTEATATLQSRIVGGSADAGRCYWLVMSSS